MKIILAAILLLSPHVREKRATEYAKVIHAMTKAYKIDPLLVVAIIRTESNFSSRHRSRTNDFGLMQLHVSRTTFPRLRGHGYILRNPVLNIYLGVKHLDMFRRWHKRKCKDDHVWWRHYKWGFRRKYSNSKWVDRVRLFHQRLIKRFRGLKWQDKKVTESPSTPTASLDLSSLSERNSYQSSVVCQRP